MRAIQSMYLGSRACVRASGKMSGWFPITQGVRQGCVMSPWLFNVFMDGIMRGELAVGTANNYQRADATFCR